MSAGGDYITVDGMGRFGGMDSSGGGRSEWGGPVGGRGFGASPPRAPHEGRPYRGRGYWWDAGWADQGRTGARFRCVPAQGAHEGRPYRGRGYWWDAGWADQGRTAGEVSVRSPPRAPTRDAPTGVVDIGGTPDGLTRAGRRRWKFAGDKPQRYILLPHR